MSIEFWTMPLAPPVMSPRMMSLACFDDVRGFFDGIGRDVLDRVDGVFGFETHRSLLLLQDLWYDSRPGERASVVHQGAPVVFGDLGAGPQYPRQPDGHRDAEQAQQKPRQPDDRPEHGGDRGPRR